MQKTHPNTMEIIGPLMLAVQNHPGTEVSVANIAIGNIDEERRDPMTHVVAKVTADTIRVSVKVENGDILPGPEMIAPYDMKPADFVADYVEAIVGRWPAYAG